jgi:beta-1,4-N-acetylglucosaminyltransferase
MAEPAGDDFESAGGTNRALITTTGVIFVTVGTTRFDALVQGVARPEALHWMKKNGYTHLVIQHGKGDEPVIPQDCPISVRSYRFQSSLEKDMQDADLILSHAGAGTVMEALRMQKRLVVVINTLLMDNHQLELANAMAKRGHLFVVTEPSDLDLEIWNDFDSFVPKPYEGGDEHDFSRLLNQHMGIPNKLD